VQALDPRDVVLYSERQYSTPRFACVRFDADLPVLWTAADDLDSGERVLVPGSMVWVNWWDGPRLKEPRTNYVALPGVAAGAGLAAAQESAACELIERDTVELWWHAGVPAPAVDPAHPAIVDALAGADPELSFTVLALPNRFGLPVIVAIVDDPAGDFACLGSACRPDAAAAIRKALIEAIHLRRMFHGLLDPDGVHWTAVRRGDVHHGLTRPFRADRRYLDDFRPDFSDVTDLLQQALAHLDPRMRPRRRSLLAARTHSDVVTPPDAAMSAIEALRADGRRLLSVDLTTPDVASVGLAAVRLIVPGLIPNTPAGFPHFGTDRFRREPAEFGWLPAELTEHELERTPMPHV
jgi:ribosomal protein S12 methylthiotransferase accessory factor